MIIKVSLSNLINLRFLINSFEMKKSKLILALLFICATLNSQTDSRILLLIRGDDIGSSHSSNLACIESYRNGIMRSVELMAPCPWFPEAVRFLKENPGLDVGVHLTFTSEWSNIKWRPLTYCPSLVDEDGYFYPMIWPNQNFPPGSALHEARWKIGEIEQEMRAQIELIKKHIPWVSHLGCHMGCESCAPEIAALVKKLAAEYKLDIDPEAMGYKYLSLWQQNDTTAEQRIKSAVKTLNNLKPGRYLFVDHPGMNTPEMQAIGHKGYEKVAIDRDAVTRVFTSSEVAKVINSKKISLQSYKSAATESQK